jgi:hypothetical protein
MILKLLLIFLIIFSTVASELVKKPAKAKGIYSVTSQLFLNFYKRRNPHNTKRFLQPVTEEFVFKELCSLNANKSTGLDEIPARFIHDGNIIIPVYRPLALSVLK